MARAPHARKLALAVAVSGVSVLARWALDPVLGDALPLSTGYVAVVVVAWLCGWGPAALAAVLVFMADGLLFVARGDPSRLFTLDSLVAAATFLGVSAVNIGIVETMRHSQRRLAGALETSRRLGEESDALARRMTVLTDALPVLIAYVDTEGRYQFNNRGYEEWFGYRREEIRGRHLRDVVGEAAYERIRPRAEAALAGRAAHFEDEMPYRFGGTRTVQGDYIPDRRDDGTVAGFYVLVSDITERRRAEAQLRESEERFRALADSSPAMIWLHGADGNEFVNREYLEFLGLTQEQLRGEGWRQVVHPEDFPEFLAAFEDAMRRRIPFEAECRIRRHDGEWRGVRTFARPRVSPRGEYLGYAGLAIDATELRLAQRRLLESDRLAAVGNLAAGLSHDMSNLIMPLGVALSELERVPLGADARDALRAAERCTAALRDLVRAVRALVRTEAAAPGPRRIDLREWWVQTTPLLRVSIPRGIRITAEIGDEALQVNVVESELIRAVLNLVVNAAEAMAEAGTREPTIRVRGRLVDGRVELSVADNGPGIPAALQSRIFEPFFSTKKGHSTGMGMSIVQDFVTASGATLTLDSGEGRGTTFTIRLPAAPAEPPVPETPPMWRAGAGARRSDGHARGSEAEAQRPRHAGDPHPPGP